MEHHEFCKLDRFEQLRRIEILRRIIMADLSKLNAATAQFNADFGAYQAAVSTALTSSGAGDQSAIDAATSAVETADAAVVTATKALPTA